MPPLSIIIPFFNEESNVEPVLAEIRMALPHAEIIAVNDGSTDSTIDKLQAMAGLTLLGFPENRGKGFAVHEGLMAATNEFCVIIDGDGQYDPLDIPLLAAELERGAHMACGYRTDRQDRRSSLVASRIANSFRDLVLRDGIRDAGSGLKAVRRSHALELLWAFEGMHRFMPSIFRYSGRIVAQVPVRHRPRLSGETKYTHRGRAWRGLRDLVMMRRMLAGSRT